ncbi:MAG: sensor histidine kinase [Planctomycetota bacterium]
MLKYAAVLGAGVAVNQFQLTEARRREALQAQLQPHFLFNALQTIGSTARQDGALAARQTTLLGDLLRQTLQDDRKKLVPLCDELSLLEPYVELQKLRFGDRLAIHYAIPDELLGVPVPDLLLQPLVENALHHGIERRPGAGSVTIAARSHGGKLELSVQDDGVGCEGDASADGIGLGTTRSRLAGLFGDAADLRVAAAPEQGTVVTVVIPMREVGDVG